MQARVATPKFGIGSLLIALTLIAGLWAMPASAALALYSAQLSGANEVPPNVSAATGVITVVHDNVANTIAVRESWSNLSTTPTGSHIHNAINGVVGPIIFGFTGVPTVLSGSIPPQTFPINPAQVTELQAGRMYANVHSISFPGGEIRGQLALVPSPSCALNPNIVVDGSFEATNDGTLANPNWSSTSTQFGTSLCTIAGCGFGALIAPRTGNGWVFFDGGSLINSETATAAQAVTLPLGATLSLSYFEFFQNVGVPPSSVLTVTVDGHVVQKLMEPTTAEAGYTQRTVDLSAYADGTSRLISFNYSRPAGGNAIHNFSMDDVAVAVTACPISFQPTFVGVASRKVHAGTNYDLPLSATLGNPSTEPRQGPLSLVYSFDRPLLNSGSFNITEGVALFTGSQVNGNDMILNFTNVADQSYLTVTVSGVTAMDGSTGGTGIARVGLLRGDVNHTRVVTLSDLGLINGQLAQPVTATNFLMDINVSGTITLSDKALTNGALTHGLGPP